MWDTGQVGDLIVTAAAGQHGVHEITYVIQGGDRTVYHGGDTLCISKLGELPDRFGRFDLALLPVNALCVRPAGDMQIVMNAREAAELASVLKPTTAVPHHYAFTNGWLGDRMITKGDRDPRPLATAVAELASATIVRLALPGEPVDVPDRQSSADVAAEHLTWSQTLTTPTLDWSGWSKTGAAI